MDINTIWQTVEPYVMAIIGALAGGTGIYALVRSFVGKWISRFEKKYDINDMAQKARRKDAQHRRYSRHGKEARQAR